MNKIAALVAVQLLTAAGSQPSADPAGQASRTLTPEEEARRNKRLEWWREAKFGMFIHWGLYAIPAGEWKGQPIEGIGEWIMHRARIPVKEYEELAAQFNPVRFNAAEWVRIAKEAGMRYVVITSKHHDGFAMYHSKVSKYNVVDATPWKRDPIKELAQECAKAGIRFGVYYSQAQGWHEPDAAGNTWDFDESKADFDKYLEEKALPQVRELLTDYGPICLIWFDTPVKMTPERAARFRDVVYSIQPDCIINGRLLKPDGGDYISAGDNQIPEVVSGDWETPATINHTWGYKKDDNDWKSPEQLIFNLVDIVSKGGNYLLNVGPTAEGVIPEPSVERLRAMGKWLKVNGEAIYGTKPTPFGAELKGREWRCTSKPGKLYVHLFERPENGRFELETDPADITRAYMLADPARNPLGITKSERAVAVTLPPTPPDEVCSVLVLETK